MSKTEEELAASVGIRQDTIYSQLGRWSNLYDVYGKLSCKASSQAISQSNESLA